jgi:hypothetical protein
MQEDGLITITVHEIYRGAIYRTCTLLRVPTSMTLLELYKIIKEETYVSKRKVAAGLEAFDKSCIGVSDRRKGTFESKFPDEKPKFVLDKRDPKKSIKECGITEDGSELMLLVRYAD